MVSMAIYFYIPAQKEERVESSLNAEQLLRGMGVTRKLVGFRYVVFMVEQVMDDPDRIQLITKRLYPDTGRQFGVTAMSVERAVRTLIRTCWERSDHSFLEHIAGASIDHIPSNSEFIDMLAGYLQRRY